MKFSLISDMHVDFPQEKTPYAKLEKNVVVAGDTGNGLVGLKFLDKMKRKGFNVFACDGNHEHYGNLTTGRDAYETAARFREDYPSTGAIEDIPIILRNGWYSVYHDPEWGSMMNDSYRCCLTSEQVNTLAEKDAYYVRKALQEWQTWKIKGVVVTHTAPCTDTLDPKYDGELSNEWYWNPHMRKLLDDFSDQIHVWCHGHTHARNDQIVSGVRVVCNPRGYPGENPGWEPMSIEI